MKKSKLINSVIAAVAVVSFSLPAIASADSGADLKGTSEKVQYSDLNVQKQAGAEQLYRRVQLASKRGCGVQSLKIAGSIRAVSDARRCYEKSLDAAVAKIDNPALTAIHEG